MARFRDDEGFLMMDMLIAIIMLTVALSAMLVVFSSGLITITKNTWVSTANSLADAQMESYRMMTSRDIGLDLSASTVNALDSTYKSDTACANPPGNTSTTCVLGSVSTVETAPTGSDTCPTTIDAWYTDTDPCVPSRTISAASSPDHHAYRIDTYIVVLAASSTERTRKEVTIVVRNGSTLAALARESSIFDCSSGVTPGSGQC
jgi:type II secretory pathway pseudopilin PulG